MTTSPFAELSASIFPSVMQAYIAVVIAIVAVGTIFGVLHKKSAPYFRENRRKSRYHRDKGEWGLEKAPVYHIVD